MDVVLPSSSIVNRHTGTGSPSATHVDSALLVPKVGWRSSIAPPFSAQ
jgi:hypothetical protein